MLRITSVAVSRASTTLGWCLILLVLRLTSLCPSVVIGRPSGAMSRKPLHRTLLNPEGKRLCCDCFVIHLMLTTSMRDGLAVGT